MYIKQNISRIYRTKIKVGAITNNTTIEDLFSRGLELLFDEYKGVINGTQTEAHFPIVTSTEKVSMNLPISEKDNETLELLSRKTSISKHFLCELAIRMILDELNL